ncbi:MAG: orotate phosphoribosyltransferase [Nitrospinales bacterium]
MKAFKPQDLAKIALDIGAVKINAEEPYKWASGYFMPVYNDNRLLLGNAEHRQLIGNGLREIIQSQKLKVDVIAGTATAGIPHATTLANKLNSPLVYVRNSPKGHGLENQIEGGINKNQNTIVVEDVISTGGSALRAIDALRSSKAIVDHCLCIFNYGFQKAEDEFAKAGCQLHSLLTFPELLDYAIIAGTISNQHKETLTEWYSNPFIWGDINGFSCNK